MCGALSLIVVLVIVKILAFLDRCSGRRETRNSSEIASFPKVGNNVELSLRESIL